MGQSNGGGGTGSHHDYVSLPNADGDDGDLYGNRMSGDDTGYARYENGVGWAGNHVDYNNVMGEYSERAYQGIESGRYPSGMEDVIKEYFTSFN
ncbi:MAG: hypothetical protein J6M27_10035 [Lachnospiraceae bacterium]|jgi:hypothetical protein|nr:hypothetical protein [Lachnospiraceae bacterium]